MKFAIIDPAAAKVEKVEAKDLNEAFPLAGLKVLFAFNGARALYRPVSIEPRRLTEGAPPPGPPPNSSRVIGQNAFRRCA